MRPHSGLLVPLVIAAVVAGCTSAPVAGPSTNTTRASSGAPSAGGTSPPTPSVENLTVSPAVRTQLLEVLAAQVGVAPSEYSGFAPGLTYYAFDSSTGTYWAGAKPMPAPSTNPNQPTQAQVASQDDGAYDVFEKPAGGRWKVFATGATGPATVCPVTVPSAVLSVWGWSPGTCRPTGA